MGVKRGRERTRKLNEVREKIANYVEVEDKECFKLRGQKGKRKGRGGAGLFCKRIKRALGGEDGG